MTCDVRSGVHLRVWLELSLLSKVACGGRYRTRTCGLVRPACVPPGIRHKVFVDRAHAKRRQGKSLAENGHDDTRSFSCGGAQLT